MNDISEIIWLAGYLEGEGCFRMSCSPRRPNALGTPSVRVAATDKDVVENAARIMGCTVKLSRRATVVGKAVFLAEVCGDNATRVMNNILPYMGHRRGAKISEVLALAASRTGIPRGDARTDIKLKNADVISVRQMVGAGAKQVEMAKKYGVSQALISLVINNTRRGVLLPTNVDGT